MDSEKWRIKWNEVARNWSIYEPGYVVHPIAVVPTYEKAVDLWAFFITPAFKGVTHVGCPAFPKQGPKQWGSITKPRKSVETVKAGGLL